MNKFIPLILSGFIALVLLAAAPGQTQPPPAPTATLEPTADPLILYHTCVDKGFWYCLPDVILAYQGCAIGALVLVGLVVGVVAILRWWVRPYLERIENRRAEGAGKRVDGLLDGRPKDSFAEATAAYLERFEKKYSQFGFRGLEDVSGAKIPDFDAAYISLRLSASPARQHRLGAKTGIAEEDLPQESFQLQETDALPEVTLDAAIQRKPRLAIIGPAGSGKSTLLQWAGVSLVRFYLRGRKALEKPEQRAWAQAIGDRPRLPVFVALREYVRFCHDPKVLREINPCSLVEFIEHFYTGLWTSIAFPPDFFKRHLRQGCLLLLDGVDEVSPDLRVKVREAVEGLVDDYGLAANRYLLASRSVAYRGAVEFKDFEQLEVQFLSREQRDQLARFWCDAIYPVDEAAKYAADLIASIERSDERVRLLARTPLMISIFVLVYYHNQRRLPNQRAEFYYRAARVLVSETNKASAPDYPDWEKLSVETRIDLLKRVAYELYTRNLGDATADELAKYIQDESSLDNSLEKAREFLSAASNRSGLLEERGGQYGFFTHKTFHEFLTGLYLAQSKRREWRTILSERVPDDQWQEVLLLAAGALAYLNALDAEDFVELMSSLGEGEPPLPPGEGRGEGEDEALSLHLAGLERAALAQADFPLDRAQKHRKTLVTRLFAGMVDTHLKPRQRFALGLALGELGDPRFPPSPLPPLPHNGGEGKLPSPIVGEGLGVGVIPPPLTPPIPAGHFRMGTNARDEEKLKEQGVDEKYIWDNEKTGQRDFIVHVSEFSIGKYPVTNAEFGCFWKAGGYGALDGEKPPWWSEIGWRWRVGLWDTQDFSLYSKEYQENFRNWLAGRPREKRGQPFYWDDPKWSANNLPLVGVSWFEAQAYCNWLSAVLRDGGQLGADQVIRLPTEAEWEKAARTPPLSPPISGGMKRGGLPGKGGRGDEVKAGLWPWGDEWRSDFCNTRELEDAFERTSPVGIFPHGASPCGALDMVGNVWEWCYDWHDPAAYQRESPAHDPHGPETGQSRVLRGGSWYGDRNLARCAFRCRNVPGYFSSDVGFRVVCAPNCPESLVSES